MHGGRRKGPSRCRRIREFESAPDGAIFLRDIRHHDDHSPLIRNRLRPVHADSRAGAAPGRLRAIAMDPAAGAVRRCPPEDPHHQRISRDPERPPPCGMRRMWRGRGTSCTSPTRRSWRPWRAITSTSSRRETSTFTSGPMRNCCATCWECRHAIRARAPDAAGLRQGGLRLFHYDSRPLGQREGRALR